MTEPTDREYCVRDRSGRIVVPWRPVGEVVETIERLEDASWSGGAESMRVHLKGGPGDMTWENVMDAARAEFRALLGLEPAADADR